MRTAVLVPHPDKETLAEAVAARLVTAVLDAQAARGVAQVSLTGGSMGSLVVGALTRTEAWRAVDASQVVVWWGDERYLPSGHADRNDTQADEAGLGTLGIDPAKVHRVAGPDRSSSAEEAAAEYEQALRDHGGGTFDVMILGVGPDGHIASLFPGHPAQQSNETIVVAVHDSPKPPPTRVSLTLECLGRSREVWFVVAGADKAAAVRHGLDGAPPAVSTAALLTGEERTLWLVDEDAVPD